jgi:hypothetical protein
LIDYYQIDTHIKGKLSLLMRDLFLLYELQYGICLLYVWTISLNVKRRPLTSFFVNYVHFNVNFGPKENRLLKNAV